LSTRLDAARSSEAKLRADASFKKEERARDGASAMTEYLENARLTREKTARLRLLRLAKEEADRQAEPAKNTAVEKRAAKVTKSAK
jgi:hypothetical protein